MSDLEASVVIDLKGNLTQQARRHEGALNSLGRNGSRHLGVLRRSAMRVDRVMTSLGNRYVALATGGALVAAGKQVGDLSAKMNQLGIDFGKNGAALKAFKAEWTDAISAASIRWGIDSDQLAASIQEIANSTGDYNFAKANISRMAMAISATGSSGDDIGKLIVEMQKRKWSEEDIKTAFDLMSEIGQRGSLNMKSMAGVGPDAFAAYQPADVKEFQEMLAIMQVFGDSTKNAEESMTSLRAFMLTINSEDGLIKLQKSGVDAIDMDTYNKTGKIRRAHSPGEMMRKIAEASDGEQTAVTAMFGNTEAYKGLANYLDEFNKTRKTLRFDKLMDVQTDGTVLFKDATDNLHEMNSQFRRVLEIGKQFANTDLAGPVDELAASIESLSTENIKDIMEAAKGAGIALGTALAGYAVLKYGNKGRNAWKNRKGGTGASGSSGNPLLDAASSFAPVPVYVVNNPGAGGGRNGGARRSGGRKVNRPSNFKLLKNAPLGSIGALGPAAILRSAGFVGLAGGAGYAIGSLISEAIEGTEVSNSIGRSIAVVLAGLGSEDAQAALDAERGGSAKYNSASRRRAQRAKASEQSEKEDPIKVEIELTGEASRVLSGQTRRRNRQNRRTQVEISGDMSMGGL